MKGEVALIFNLNANEVEEERSRWLHVLFPNSYPVLWCPILSHYREDGTLDEVRIHSHMSWLSQWVKGWLVPSSTGDGWEMNSDEEDQWLDLLENLAPSLGESWLWVGVLRENVVHGVQRVKQLSARFPWKLGQTEPSPPRLGGKLTVCGVTVCPPTGAELTQKKIQADLETVAALGVPVCLYQLPQVTGNEVAPETFKNLTEHFGNLLAVKDSSGQDRLAVAMARQNSVLWLRGAEEGYLSWWKPTGGVYDGFLLSTANSLAVFYQAMLQAQKEGDEATAKDLDQRLSRVARRVFAVAGAVPFGNPFAHANRALDHFFAFGRRALSIESPRSHNGVALPMELLETTANALAEVGWFPKKGYLE